MSEPTAASVLIIDDEAQIRRFLGISLRAQGYE
ncbi:MAG: DNA-binding response regulator, partial [Arenimonas sp.]